MIEQLSPRALAIVKAILFTACLLPLARLGYGLFLGDPGPNPVEFVQRQTGTWTINFLMITLCITPLRAITGAHWLIRLRRMLGLFCFFYGLLHFLSYIGFDHSFEVEAIARDVFKRPFVSAGFAAFVLLIPLAATSNNRAIRALGGRRWQDLHRTVYLIGILAVTHYFWLVKASALIYPVLYAVALAILLGWRARAWMHRHGPFSLTAKIQPLRFFPRRPD